MKKIICLIILGLLLCSLIKAQAAEQQVWFTPMINAYKTNPMEAREIATKYLNGSLKEFSSFETYKLSDKEGSVYRAVGLIQDILIYENKIEPAERFGQNLGFMDLIEQVLVKAKEEFAQLKRNPEYIDGINGKKYIQDTLEYCIQEWIQIREDIIAHEDSSLSLTIKSDKQVYEAGEDIIIHASLENISDTTIEVNKGNYLDWNDTCRFFFKNEKGEECALTYSGSVDILIPNQLQSRQLFEFWSYTIGLLKDKEFKWQSFKFELVKGKDYSFIGKQTIHMKDYGLNSNAITIEMKEKKSSLSAEGEITLLRKKISDIESRCTPKEGTSKEEVERIFGEGKPAPIGKMPTASPDSPARSYVLCENGALYVHYKGDRVLWADYLDPYSVKGRVIKEVSIEKQLQEARPRFQQMEIIHSAYLKRIEALKQDQSLQLFIKSDKEAYNLEDNIILTINLDVIKNGEVASRLISGEGQIEVINNKDEVGLIELGPTPGFEGGRPITIQRSIPTSPLYNFFTSNSKLKKIDAGVYKIRIKSKDWLSNAITVDVKEASYSNGMDEARKEFEALKKEWEKEGRINGYGIYSSAAQYWQGKAGQAIIDMGKRALPFIIEEIKKGNHLFNYPASRITGIYNGMSSGSGAAQETSEEWILRWEENKNNPKWNVFISR